MRSSCVSALPLLLYILATAIAVSAHEQDSSGSTTLIPIHEHIQAGARVPNNPTCLLRFYNNETDFEKCMSNVCFIFLREEPYIMLDSRMKTDADSILFPCKNPRSAFSELHGAAFSIMEMTEARESLCVWGGPKCLFNDMVEFIDKHSPKYQFAATGLLTETSWRRGKKNVIPSISIVTEQLVIVGPSNGTRGTGNPMPILNVLRPFRFDAWVLFGSFLIVIGVLALMTAYVFGPIDRKPRSLFYFLFCKYPKVAVANTTPPVSPEESRDASVDEVAEKFSKRVSYRLSSYKITRGLLQLSASLIAAIFLLFYEMAVVHFLFIKSGIPDLKNPNHLSKGALQTFSIEKNAATESVWNVTVFEKGKYGLKKSDYPWERCSTNAECLDWALEDSKPSNRKYAAVDFVVGFQTSLTYHILKRSVCTKLTIYRTGERQLYSFGAGWLYGSGVPEQFRKKVDAQLIDVRVKQEIHRIIDEESGKLDTPECTSKIQDIDGGVLGACILIFAVPSLFLLLVVLIYYLAKMFPAAKNSREKRDDACNGTKNNPNTMTNWSFDL